MKPALAALALLISVSAASAAPRLLVVVSVDQLRGDAFRRSDVQFSQGLKALYEQGSVWSDAHHAHIPIETAPGHAAILTGKFPNQNGIVSNDWWDRSLKTPVYTVSDSVHKWGPENLLAYTLGDALKAKDPLSRVVSVSVKDRSAILMGGKKADAAVWYDKKKAEFVTSSYYGAAPAWLAAFNAKLKAEGGALAKLSDAQLREFVATPAADRLLLDLVETALQEYRLGEDEHPDILAVGFSATDYVGHTYGPDSPQMTEQLKSLDAVIGELMGFLKAHLGAKTFDLALTSDHGVIPVPESPQGIAMKARRRGERAVEADMEKGLQAMYPAPGKKWILGFFFPNIYFNRELGREKGLDWPVFLRRAASLLRTVDGMAEVYVPGEWFPDAYADFYKRSYYPGRSGDLVARPAEGALITEAKLLTSHGAPYRYDTHVPLIFWGPDFKLGLNARKAWVVDLAPTCAKVLGVDFPPAEGSRVLVESLAAP